MDQFWSPFIRKRQVKLKDTSEIKIFHFDLKFQFFSLKPLLISKCKFSIVNYKT